MNLAVILAAALLTGEQTYAEVTYILLNHERQGIVATLYEKKPYVSVMPYILDDKGRPVVFISELAIHTQNLEEDSSTSFLVTYIKEDDLFNSPRVTLSGNMKVVPEDEVADLRKKYLERFPDAEEWIDFGDFSFFRLELDEIYLVGGFGEIGFVEIEEYEKAVKKSRPLFFKNN